jgi:lipoprotein-releasing system ATP-binding protein
LNAANAITADSVGKTYRSGGGTVAVFHNLCLSVSRGERIAIVGESGAGKSTLLHLLGGLERPDSGKIFFDSEDITVLRDQGLAEFRNRKVGFVWQNPSLLPEFTALENVMMPLLIRGVVPEQAAASALGRLEEVGLRHRSAHRAGELSGGEQQRVALARALAGEPKFLLADEPTGSLDFRTGDAIVRLLSELHTVHGLTSVFVTHNLSFARKCDRVLELKKGNLQESAVIKLQEAGVEQDATRLDGGTYV